VVGDALCSFNPAYGQGMSTAALQAGALRDTLADGDHELARRFFRATTKPIDVAWQMAVGNDLALPEVEGTAPLPFAVIMFYFDRLGRAAEQDPIVAAQFARVVHMMDKPTTLFHPAVLWRALAGNLRRRPTDPAGVPA
jgi:2-polyprenyl-6-methoxyphenol hydroxylase-like FAD-dependent oxidoreductase